MLFSPFFNKVYNLLLEDISEIQILVFMDKINLILTTI